MNVIIAIISPFLQIVQEFRKEIFWMVSLVLLITSLQVYFYMYNSNKNDTLIQCIKLTQKPTECQHSVNNNTYLDFLKSGEKEK